MTPQQTFEQLMTLGQQYNTLCKSRGSYLDMSQAIVDLLQQWLSSTPKNERATILTDYFSHSYNKALFPNVLACLSDHQKQHPGEILTTIWNEDIVFAHITYSGKHDLYDDIILQQLHERLTPFNETFWNKIILLPIHNIERLLSNATVATQAMRADILHTLNNHANHQQTIKEWCYNLSTDYIKKNDQTPYFDQITAQDEFEAHLSAMKTKNSIPPKKFISILKNYIPKLDPERPLSYWIDNTIQQGWLEQSAYDKPNKHHDFLYNLFEGHGFLEHLPNFIPKINNMINAHQFLHANYIAILVKQPQMIEAFIERMCLEIMTNVTEYGRFPDNIDDYIETFKALRLHDEVGNIMDQKHTVDVLDFLSLNENNSSIQKSIRNRFAKKSSLKILHDLQEFGPAGLAGSVRILGHINGAPNMIDYTCPILELEGMRIPENIVQHHQSWKEQQALSGVTSEHKPSKITRKM